MTSRSTGTDRPAGKGAPFSDYEARLHAAAPGLFSLGVQDGATYADLFGEQSFYTRCRLHQRASPARVFPPDYTARRYSVCGAGLRLMTRDGLGYAATTTPDDLAPLSEAAASRLKGQAPAAPPGLHVRPEGPGEAEPRALLEQAAEAAFSLDERVVEVEVSYQHRVRRIVVATSQGQACTCATELTGLRVAVTLNDAGHRTTAQAVVGSAAGPEYFAANPPEDAARMAVARARARAGAHPSPTGEVPVVLAGGWGGVWLHEAVGHLLEADTVAAGGIPGPGHLGRVVAPPGVTLYDDATVPGGRGTAPCDDEAKPAGRALLIEGGVLRGFLADRLHAARYGWPMAGAARRQDYRFPPLPRMTNLILEPGAVPPEDLIAGVPDGLFVRCVGHGVVYPAGGRYAFEVRDAQRIEQGRLTHPVTGVRIVGEAASALAGIAGIGTDFRVDTARGLCRKGDQVVPVSVGMPSVLIRSMTVEPAPVPA